MAKGFYERLQRIWEINSLINTGWKVSEIAEFRGIKENVVKDDIECGKLLQKFLFEVIRNMPAPLGEFDPKS